MSGFVITEVQSSVLFLRLNRPKVKNAINLSMLEELDRALEKAANDSRISVAVLSGHGTDFCCGLDVLEVFGMSAQTAEKIQFLPELRAWREFPKPKVCAVEGLVRGLGVSLVETSDISIAGRGASFQHNELALGICPSGGTSQLLPRLVGLRVATDMLLSGRCLAHDEALAYGLVSRVVERGGALEEASRVGESLAKLSRPLVAELKALIALSSEGSVSSGMSREAQSFIRMFRLADRTEGTGAALQQRPPTFKHC